MKLYATVFKSNLYYNHIPTNYFRKVISGGYVALRGNAPGDR